MISEETRRHRRRSLVATALSFVAACSAGLAAAAAESLPDAVSKASELRDSAQYWAKRVKRRKGLPQSAVVGAEQRYEDARAAIEAWRLGLKTELALRQLEPSEAQTERLRRAADKVAHFIGFAEGLLSRGGPATAVPVAMIASVAGDLIDTTLRLMKYYREGRTEERDQVLKVVDELKWKQFEAV